MPNTQDEAVFMIDEAELEAMLSTKNENEQQILNFIEDMTRPDYEVGSPTNTDTPTDTNSGDDGSNDLEDSTSGDSPESQEGEGGRETETLLGLFPLNGIGELYGYAMKKAGLFQHDFFASLKMLKEAKKALDEQINKEDFSSIPLEQQNYYLLKSQRYQKLISEREDMRQKIEGILNIPEKVKALFEEKLKSFLQKRDVVMPELSDGQWILLLAIAPILLMGVVMWFIGKFVYQKE